MTGVLGMRKGVVRAESRNHEASQKGLCVNQVSRFLLRVKQNPPIIRLPRVFVKF